MKTDKLYRVERKDAQKLGELLTECFANYPLYLQLIPQKDKRQKLLPELFNCELDELFEYCEIYADSPELGGIIIVSDERQPCSPLKYFMLELQYAVRIGAHLIRDDKTLKTLWNFIKGKDYLNSVWSDDLNSDKRLHIVYFAVRPSMRGHGVASKLMNAVQEYADQNELLLSLETHNEKNMHMYEHYGFRTFEVVQKHFALKQFCMVR